jgi:hypothetical protein
MRDLLTGAVVALIVLGVAACAGTLDLNLHCQVNPDGTRTCSDNSVIGGYDDEH